MLPNCLFFFSLTAELAFEMEIPPKVWLTVAMCPYSLDMSHSAAVLSDELENGDYFCCKALQHGCTSVQLSLQPMEGVIGG